MGIPEKIKAIQDEIHRTQLNKATEHHIGLLKAKIAKLKREQEAEQVKKSGRKTKLEIRPRRRPLPRQHLVESSCVRW